MCGLTVHWKMAQGSCGVSLTGEHRVCLDTGLGHVSHQVTHSVLSTLTYFVNCFWSTVCFPSFVSSLQLEKLKENFYG